MQDGRIPWPTQCVIATSKLTTIYTIVSCGRPHLTHLTGQFDLTSLLTVVTGTDLLNHVLLNV